MNDGRGKIGVVFLLCLSVVIIFVIIYYFALINVNVGKYFKYLYKTNARVVNKDLAELLNANSIVNLPNVNLVTNNAEIDSQQKCKNGAIYMGESDGTKYLDQCLQTCGSRARVTEIGENDEYYSNNERLIPGAWCVLNTAKCNMDTGYVVATLNSVACKSKYPNMFGGQTASKVVACDNETYPATGSVLYDHYRNEPVNPLTVDMTGEDERLPDGSYRFACKFADDINGNQYIANPLNRFHPMRDHCNKTIFTASRNVKARVHKDGWYCDCGDVNETRVKHLDENDKKSTCTSCYEERSGDTLGTDGRFVAPYNCFTLSSTYNVALTEFPCTGTKFTERGNMCSTVTLKVKRASDGSDDTVRGIHAMPFANADLYPSINAVADFRW